MALRFEANDEQDGTRFVVYRDNEGTHIEMENDATFSGVILTPAETGQLVRVLMRA